jgi:hypothetical protein
MPRAQGWIGTELEQGLSWVCGLAEPDDSGERIRASSCATAAVLGGARWPTSDRGGRPIGLGAHTFCGPPPADGEAVGQDAPHRAAERFRMTGLPFGDAGWSCWRATRQGLVVGAYRPGCRDSVRRLVPGWAGPARPLGAARHRRSRYRGRSGPARPAGRAWPQHRRRSRSPLVGRGAGSVWSGASVLACCETPSFSVALSCGQDWRVHALRSGARGTAARAQVVLGPTQRSRFIPGTLKVARRGG